MYYQIKKTQSQFKITKYPADRTNCSQVDFAIPFQKRFEDTELGLSNTFIFTHFNTKHWAVVC